MRKPQKVVNFPFFWGEWGNYKISWNMSLMEKLEIIFGARGGGSKIGKIPHFAFKSNIDFCLRAPWSLLLLGQSFPSFVSKGLWIRTRLFFYFCMWNSLDEVLTTEIGRDSINPSLMKVNNPRAQGSPD